MLNYIRLALTRIHRAWNILRNERGLCSGYGSDHTTITNNGTNHDTRHLRPCYYVARMMCSLYETAARNSTVYIIQR